MINVKHVFRMKHLSVIYHINKRLFVSHSSSKLMKEKMLLFHTSHTLRRNIQLSSKLAIKSKMFFFQNPFRWLNVRLDLYTLREKWDPSFTLPEFIIGAKQAVCTVINLASEKKFDALKGLIEQTVLQKIVNDIINQMKEKSIQNLILNPEDIQVVIPYEVNLSSIGEKNYCDIDMLFIAHKFDISRMKSNDERIFIILEIKMKLNRDYSKGALPSWIVTNLKLNIKTLDLLSS